MRTQRSLISFKSAFKLKGFDTPLAAGTYELKITEEETDTMLTQGWHRVSTELRTPALGKATGLEQWNPVQQSDVDQALARDAATFPPAVQRQSDRIS